MLNATGVLVHTNLGRAPLSRAARDALAAAAGTCDVEFDLATGARAGQRGHGAIGALRAAVPNAQAAGVVNNNAAALVLAATVLAAGREIVISRGELIEIGDRFRLPDLLTSTGARLTEVGTTNRTTVADYEQAITADTAMILKVHPSNYKVEGFTKSAAVGELAALGVPLVHDIGSGLLAPHPLLPDEPDAATSLREGANLVTASGDKLLGGPQAGLLLGDEPLVRRLLRHPLARALRVDKLTLAALEATIAGPPPPVARVAERRSKAHQPSLRTDRDRSGVARDPRHRGERRGGGRRRRRPGRHPAKRRDRPRPRTSRSRSATGPPSAGARSRPSSAASSGAACCLTCARSTPPTTTPWSPPSCAARERRRRQSDVRGRHRRARRPREVDAGPRADRDGAGPVGGGTPPRHDDRPRLRLDDPADPDGRPPGEKLAFVDVPGHERFVPNMLAGLGPVPAVMFVVAADGGWMPQSAEHLAAVDALGVRHGLLVITRADLADPGPATRQALAEIAQTSLGDVEAIAVSAVTGQGLDELRAALGRLTAALGGRSPGGRPPVRLWIDRSFTIRGAGTVVTGTLPAGTVRNGQELLLSPVAAAGPGARACRLSASPPTRSTGVARVALNLRGVPADLPARGMALIEPGRWTLATELDVRITPPAADPQPKFPPELLLHIGAARTRARLRILGTGSAWRRSTPGCGSATRCRCTRATGCCCATPARPGSRSTARPCSTRPRRRSPAEERARPPSGNCRPGPTSRPRPTCSAGTSCCAPLSWWRPA